MYWQYAVGGDPVHYVDPYGLCEEDIFEGWGNFGLDCLQKALDVVGFIDPTPISDLANAGISLARGNYTDAAYNFISAVPAIGDFVGKSLKTGSKVAANVADGVSGLGKYGDKALDATEAIV